MRTGFAPPGLLGAQWRARPALLGANHTFAGGKFALNGPLRYAFGLIFAVQPVTSGPGTASDQSPEGP